MKVFFTPFPSLDRPMRPLLYHGLADDVNIFDQQSIPDQGPQQSVDTAFIASAQAAQGAKASVTASCSSITLRKGSSGACVETLTSLLRARGWTDQPIASTFDGQVDTSVRSFQGTHSLSVDGIVGANTWRALQVEGGAAPVGSTAFSVTGSAGGYTPSNYTTTSYRSSPSSGASTLISAAAPAKPSSVLDKLKQPKVMLLAGGGLLAVALLGFLMTRGEPPVPVVQPAAPKV